MGDILKLNSPIEISGLDDDKPYIELTTRLCWLDYANLNGVGLASGSEDSYKSLEGMPVVAKINASGNSFGSHEVAIDDKGKFIFNTSAYGVHTEVWQADDTVDIPEVGQVTVPCLFAKSRIWKRFGSVVNLIANKMTDPEKFNGGLWSSWELQGGEYTLNDKNQKIYSTYTFLSNCLIDVPPAYGEASKTLLVASEEFEKQLEAAYKNDIELSNKEEEEKLGKANEQSALTTRDLRKKIDGALNKNGYNSNPYYYLWEIYPNDQKVLAYNEYRESEDDYVVVSYSVENDVVTIGEIKEKKLSELIAEYKMYTPEQSSVNVNINVEDTAKLIAEKEAEIKVLKDTVDTLTSEVTDKDEKLIKAGQTIVELQASVEELTPFKVKADELAQAEQERLDEVKRQELKEIASNSGYFTDEELETSEELQTLISEKDENGLKLLIAEKVISGATPVKKVEKKEDETIVSSKNETLSTTTMTDNNYVDFKAVMQEFFKN